MRIKVIQKGINGAYTTSFEYEGRRLPRIGEFLEVEDEEAVTRFTVVGVGVRIVVDRNNKVVEEYYTVYWK